MISEAVADDVQKELLQNLLFWVTLLAFWIFLDKTAVFKSFFLIQSKLSIYFSISGWSNLL